MPSRRPDNRAALLQAARGCVAERGIDATTARDVAVRARTSLGAIGYHFGTTRALVNEALAETMLEAAEAIHSRRLPPGSMIRTTVHTAEDQRGLAAAAFEAAAAAVRDPSDHQVRDHYRSLRDAVGRATEPKLDELDAMLLAALIDGITLHALIDEDVMASITELSSRADELLIPSTHSSAGGGPTRTPVRASSPSPAATECSMS